MKKKGLAIELYWQRLAKASSGSELWEAMTKPAGWEDLRESHTGMNPLHAALQANPEAVLSWSRQGVYQENKFLLRKLWRDTDRKGRDGWYYLLRPSSVSKIIPADADPDIPRDVYDYCHPKRDSRQHGWIDWVLFDNPNPAASLTVLQVFFDRYCDLSQAIKVESPTKQKKWVEAVLNPDLTEASNPQQIRLRLVESLLLWEGLFTCIDESKAPKLIPELECLTLIGEYLREARDFSPETQMIWSRSHDAIEAQIHTEAGFHWEESALPPNTDPWQVSKNWQQIEQALDEADMSDLYVAMQVQWRNKVLAEVANPPVELREEPAHIPRL